MPIARQQRLTQFVQLASLSRRPWINFNLVLRIEMLPSEQHKSRGWTLYFADDTAKPIDIREKTDVERIDRLIGYSAMG